MFDNVYLYSITFIATVSSIPLKCVKLRGTEWNRKETIAIELLLLEFSLIIYTSDVVFFLLRKKKTGIFQRYKKANSLLYTNDP